jgi:hypothetical protein
MSANLRALTREKSEVPMKRLLMPATTLAKSLIEKLQVAKTRGMAATGILSAPGSRDDVHS